MRAAEHPALSAAPVKGVAHGLRDTVPARKPPVARAAPRGLLTFLVLIFALILAALPLHAEKARPPVSAGLSPLQLEVYINDQPTQLIGEIFRAADGRFLARRSEMEALGIAPPGKGSPEEMIGLDALPGLSSRYEEARQSLHLTLPESLRKAREYDVKHTGALPPRAETTLSRDYGLVANYNAYGTAARGYSGTGRTYSTGTLSLDTRAFSPYGVLQNSSIVGTSLARQGALRLESSYVFAHQDSATLTTIGDAVSGGLNWTRPVRFGGGQISRSFSLRPDLVTAPLPSVSGSAAVPSTVDVFVDNMRIASQSVGAGPFRLTNLPVSGDSGTARVVVRDITGKETVTSMPFFASSKLLAPGTLDFSLDAGYPRHNYALQSFDYSKKFMGQGSLRYGLRPDITLEAHAEGTARFALAGGGATLHAGRWGIFSLAGAGSWNAGDWGGMGHAAWQGSFRGIFLGASTQRTFGRFTDVAAVTAQKQVTQVTGNFLDSGFFVLNQSTKVPKALDRVTVGLPIARWNASLAASFVNLERDRKDTSRLLSLTWSQTFAKKYNTFVSVFSDVGSRRQTGVTAGLSFMLGDDVLVSGSGGASRTERSGSLEVARMMGDKEYDYGWRLFDQEGTTSARGAQGMARTPYARLGAGLRQEGKSVGGYGEVDGALIAAPGGVFAARRVHDAFAIVDVGAPGVEVLHENRPIGRSGASGKVLVPDATSFQRSKVAIAPETLPGEAHASLTETEIMPNFRGSATVNIKTVAARDTARVEIRDARGEHLPPGTRLTHEESGKPFTIGYDGLTFLPEIDNTNTLHIEIGTRGCTVRFRRDDRQGAKGRVGPLTCALQ